MSWLQRLNETYDACFGSTGLDVRGLAPVSSVMQRTQIEISLYADGTFESAVLENLETVMFTTEDSASRSGTAPAPNPLTEQLEYCAKGMEKFGGDPTKHHRYAHLLTKWNESGLGDPKTIAVQKYVDEGSLLHDLIKKRIITDVSGELEKIKVSKTTKLDPAKIWVRWRVLSDSDVESATWENKELQDSWRHFEQTLSTEKNLCLMSGTHVRTTQKHPKGIRRGGDNAKLISSNDSKGFTYRGRFHTSEEAASLGYEASQKSHNTLRWLIKRLGVTIDDQTVVAWAVGGEPIPGLVLSTLDLLRDEGDDLFPLTDASSPPAERAPLVGDAGQAFARRLNKHMQGYRAKLGEREGVVVMVLDSATPGRMAILYYRELRGSEFLDRIERWHDALAWPQNFGKALHFVGAPSPRDIAEAAYGRRVDDKLRKATVERLLPCIVDGRPLPRDLEQSVVRRATNRAGLEPWEFERTLGIACSLVKGTHPERNYTMNLDEARTTRDYLYGRLLAIADDVEGYALFLSKQSRDTSASRLMQRFADHPFTTWRTIRLQLQPYLSQLRSSRPGTYAASKDLLDRLTSSFQTDREGVSDFESNHRLSGEFLLGFHSQEAAFRSVRTKRFGGDSDAVRTQEGEEK